jgi:dienelactone hydrolase
MDLIRAAALACCIIVTSASLEAQAPKTITFPSKDSLPITADLYAPLPATAPFIVLFHMAGSSRGEYREIAPRLVAMGYNCMAVDQRAGGDINGVKNETATRAKAAGRSTAMLDAMPDLEAALQYANSRLAKGSLIAWGSSYSASLALLLAGREPGLLDGVLAFSPGEYFAEPPGGPTLVRDAVRNIRAQVFITSARGERKDWRAIYEAIRPGLTRTYLPEGEGRHGSLALAKSTPGQEEYWQAVRVFLYLRFPRSKP